jgi:segregation and condensation protein B
MEFLQQKALIESLIFASSEPLTLKQVLKITGFKEDVITSAINQLIQEYEARGSGIRIVEVAEGYQMVTHHEFSPWIRQLRKDNHSARLSQPALETLAIIAYKQPLTRLEIDQIRGVNSEGAVKSLVEKRLIKIVGKKEAPGRPFLYGTTQDFLQYFGLKNLMDLPPLNDIFKEDAA